MPFMDGLELAHEAKKIYPWIRILFISGFDDFSYAKSAIQLQADDYLLKPIKQTELEDSLKVILDSLDAQKNQVSIKGDNEELLSYELHKNHFLNGLFKGDLSMSDVIKSAEIFGVSLAGKKVSVLLATNHYNKNFDDYFHFSEKLNRFFGKDSAILFSSLSSRFIKLIIFHSDYDRLLEKCYQTANTLIHELDMTASDIAVGIGPIVDRVSDIPHSYDMAKQLLHTYGSIRTEKIISFVDNVKEGELSPSNPFKIDLADQLATLSLDDIDAFIKTIDGSDLDVVERQRMFRFFVLMEIDALLLKKQGQKTTSVYHIKDAQEMSDIAKHMDRYHKYLKHAITYLLEVEINPSMSKYRSIIQQALGYIDEHFSNPDMTLKIVAEFVSLSPSHFSTIFSQSLGKTFIDYLTEQRINYAKKLLITTDDKLASITLEVGYNDSNYFSYLFKKKEGLSPSDYRKK